MSTVSENRSSTPVRLCAIALTDLVSAAVESYVLPYPDRVTFERHRTGAFDVGLVDPDLVSDGWHERAGHPLVALSRDGNPGAARRARELGALSVMGPDFTDADLIRAVENANRLAQQAHAVELAELTGREVDMLTLICSGLSNAEIAKSLYLSPNSVKCYIRTAYRKIGVTSRSQAVIWGLEHGL
jgi:DNA-binding NarL/FixJ family response regulator